MDVRIQEEKIDVSELIGMTKREDAGAVVTFQGTVRKYTDRKEVKGLFYESYKDMAIKVLKTIVEEAGQKYDILDINVVHRTGYIELMDDSVAICVSSHHRKDAFMACEYVINEIKAKAPIWKKDIFPSGGTEWHD